MPFDATINELRDIATRAYVKTCPEYDPVAATAIPRRIRLIAGLIAIVTTSILSVWFATIVVPLI